MWLNNIPLESRLATINSQIEGYTNLGFTAPEELYAAKLDIESSIVARDTAAANAAAEAVRVAALVAQAAFEAIPRESPSGSAYLPPFRTNQSGGIQHSDHAISRSGKRNRSSNSSYSGVCSAHWGTNDVYNSLNANGLIPEKLTSSKLLISANSINNIKNLLNTLIFGWVQGGDVKTYSNYQTFSSTNEKLTITNIVSQAQPDTIIITPLWDDILSKLQIFDTASSIGGAASQYIDAPNTNVKITRTNYNNLIKSIELISKACKCNSDCACNMVCNCNADCGCNY